MFGTGRRTNGRHGNLCTWQSQYMAAWRKHEDSNDDETQTTMNRERKKKRR